MTSGSGFSLSRWWSIVRKEFLQLRRDRVTFAMIVGCPSCRWHCLDTQSTPTPSISIPPSSTPTTPTSHAASSGPEKLLLFQDRRRTP